MKSTLLISLCATAAAAFRFSSELKPPPLVADELDFSAGIKARSVLEARAAKSGMATFNQQVDHADPSQGTFSQRYWWSTEFWTGPGAPVVFMTPGESAADGYTGYLTNRTLTGQFAKAMGAAVIMMEHRYWGNSSPFDELSTKNMRFLTLNNSIYDLTNFARTVSLPFDTNGTSNAPAAPWVLSGGSYSGALTAWVHHVAPGTFWAYHASSAVVQSIQDFWTYFEPVRLGMPQNCSADVERVIDYVDTVLTMGSDDEVQALKERFGLGSIEHSDDFASALENGPWNWQGNNFDIGYSDFYKFCDYVENAVAGVFDNYTCAPGPDGVGLEKALDGYALWSREVMLPGNCENTGYFKGQNSTACFDSYNASSPLFTDLTVGNYIDRQWNWFLCNEPFAFWQDGAPLDQPTIVSRFVNVDFWERQCALFFPTSDDGYTYGIADGRTVEDVNDFTGGWDAVDTTRLMWANGQFDPWLDATVSSSYRPAGPLESTKEAPVFLIPGGIHCSDLLYANAQANEGLMEIVQQEISVMKGWVDEFYANKKRAVPFRA